MLGVFLITLFSFIATGIPIAFSLFLSGACLVVFMGQANFVLLPQYTMVGGVQLLFRGKFEICVVNMRHSQKGRCKGGRKQKLTGPGSG